MKGLVIALHDVAPSTLGETERWRALVAGITDGPVSLLVVPRYGGRESWRAGPGAAWLRARWRAGDEAVMHGYSHLSRDGRDGCELRGRDARSIEVLIEDGARELAAAGLEAEGFISPSYVHPPATDASCRSAGLRWWATRTALRDEGRSCALPSVGLGASTAVRRLLSPPAARLAARLLAAAPVIRLDLHPADLRHSRLERSGCDLLELLLAQDRRPVTHAAVLEARLPGGWPQPAPARR